MKCNSVFELLKIEREKKRHLEMVASETKSVVKCEEGALGLAGLDLWRLLVVEHRTLDQVQEYWVRLSVIASFFTFASYLQNVLKEEMLNIFIPYPDRIKLGMPV